VIDDEAAARTLANAILADLALYNDARIRAATNVRIALAREIGEARDLFAPKVAPDLHGIFESALDARLGGSASGYRDRPLVPAEPDYIERDGSDDSRDTSGPGRLLLLSVVVMIAGLSVIWWMLNRAG
jgi:hypothetical protein